MNKIKINVDEKAKSSYYPHFLNTDPSDNDKFSLYFDQAEKLELQDILQRITYADANKESVTHLMNYGNKLYNLLFGKEMGDEFKKMRKEGKDGFCMYLHLPSSLEILPWEYLADDKGFLFNGRENFLIRVPSEEKAVSINKISTPIRVLVIISNPPDLPEEMKLDVVKEKRLIKEALRSLMEKGNLAVRWEDEASLKRIHNACVEFNPHIIHYTGHGSFNDDKGGALLLEDDDDKSLNVGGPKLAKCFGGRDVRLVVLSACQTAVPKKTDSFSSVAGALINKGIPSVIAMKQKIRDDSASIFASMFYKALASSQPVDVALGEARLSMTTKRESKSFIDWGIPVLLSSASDQNLFNLDIALSKPVLPSPKGFSKNILPNPGDILFQGRQKEHRQVTRALRSGDARCLMIMGPGGIGKSSLTARAVEQNEEYFHAVLTINCRSVPSAEKILQEINYILNENENHEFDQILKRKDLDISQKIEYLPKALRAAKYLIIFDNFENMIDATKEPHIVKDENVRYIFEILTTNLKESRIIITSRQDIDFMDGYNQGNVLRISLRELTQNEAFRLMENMQSLHDATDNEKKLIFEKVGGIPYALDLVARASLTMQLGRILDDIKNIQKDFVDKTLLNSLYEWLPDEETRKFFRKTSVYRIPVTQDFLVAIGGSDERISNLLHKSLLTKIAGDMYEMHTITRTFGFELLKKIDGAKGLRETQITAAERYFETGEEIKNDENKYVDYLSESRWFYYTAKEYDTAGKIVRSLSEPLIKWGSIELVRRMNEETVGSATGIVKAYALQNLGMIHHQQGKFDEAMIMYQKALEISEELGNKWEKTSILHDIGAIHQERGKYEEAEKIFQVSLKIDEELGDEIGTAYTYHQLGLIYADQSRYDEAKKMYIKSLKISKDLGKEVLFYKTLINLTVILEDQNTNEESIRRYKEILEMCEQHKDKEGRATALNCLGKIYLRQGNYNDGIMMFQKSLKLFEELGYKRGILNNLFNLGRAYKDQILYDEAMKSYEESLRISKEIEDKEIFAKTLGDMGEILFYKKKYKEALINYQSAYLKFDELGSDIKYIMSMAINTIQNEIGNELFRKYLEEIRRMRPKSF